MGSGSLNVVTFLVSPTFFVVHVDFKNDVLMQINCVSSKQNQVPKFKKAF